MIQCVITTEKNQKNIVTSGAINSPICQLVPFCQEGRRQRNSFLCKSPVKPRILHCAERWECLLLVQTQNNASSENNMPGLLDGQPLWAIHRNSSTLSSNMAYRVLPHCPFSLYHFFFNLLLFLKSSKENSQRRMKPVTHCHLLWAASVDHKRQHKKETRQGSLLNPFGLY